MSARATKFAAALQALLLMATLILPALTSAAVWTDQADYSPGSTVTISGDNGNGAGYLAGETVHVEASGPNSWTDQCDATADDSGAWSCQVLLWDNDLAIGAYSYTATGQTSGVTETGTFTDARSVSITSTASPFWSRTGLVANGFDVAVSGLYTCTTAGSSCSSVQNITLTVSGGVSGSKVVTGLVAAVTDKAWSTILSFRTPGNGGDFGIPADGKYNLTATLNYNSGSTNTGSANNYFGVDNTKPSTTIECDNGPCPASSLSSVSVKLTASDPGNSNTSSGLAGTLYCVDNTDSCVPGTNYAGPFTVSRVNGSTFYVRYGSSDVAGNVETTKSQTIAFTTDSAPTVNSTTPVNSATGVTVGSNVTINFSEAIHFSGSWFTISCATSGSHAANPGSNNAASITLDPTVNFAPGETCTVTIVAAEVADTDAADPPDTMAANHVFSFTTADTAPTVTSSTPSNGATGVALTGGVITFNFSEAVNVDFITVACASSGNHTFSRTNNGTSAVSFTLAVGESYASGESCLVTLNSNTVHDLDAVDPPDGLAANYSFTFTALVATSPSVTTVTCPASQTYTGSAIEPCTYTVTGAGGLNIGPTAVPSANYANNINVGTASASYAYPGDATHTGSNDSENFNITQASSTTTVTCPASQTYTGSAIEPCTYTVTGAGGLNIGTTAVPSANYSNNINVGTASASFTYAGDANHSSSNDSENFSITQASSTTTVTCLAGPFVYNGSAQEPCTYTVSGANLSIPSTAVPSLGYSDNVHAGTATASYAYAGDANHTGSSDSESFTIDKADTTTTVVCGAGPFVYNGSAHEPCTASWISNEADAEGDTLTVVYTDNVHAGTAGASAEFLGDADHNGSSDSESFTIDPRDITIKASDQTKVLGATFTFTGTEFTLSSGSMVAGESVASVTLTSTGAPAAAVIGIYPIIPSAPIFGAGTLASDYDVSFSNGNLSVRYAGSGNCLGSAGHAILQPINADGSSINKQGSTVPAKFRVCNALGQSIGTPGVVASFRLVGITGAPSGSVNEPVDSTTPDTAFRWSAADQQWIYNISTKPLTKNKTYYYEILLNDSTTINFSFTLK